MKTIQNRLEQIIASSNAIIYSAEIQAPYATTFISDNIKEQLGYEQADFIDDPMFWHHHIHPDDELCVLDSLNHVPKKAYCAVDYRFLHKDGSYRWIHHDVKCAHDPDGKPTELVGFWIDVTDSKDMEQALQDSDAKYRDIFEAAHDIIILMDKDSNILNANHRAELVLGYSKSELLQMNTIEHFYVPEDRIMMRHMIDDLIKGLNREYTVRWIAKDGRIIDLDGASAPRFSPSGEFLSTICTLRDVTERNVMKESLKRSENRFSTVFDNSPVPTCISRLEDEHFVDVNDAFVNLLGYPREELIGHTALELNLWVSPEDRSDMTQRVLEKGSIRTFEIQARTKSGEIRDFLESVELIDLGDEPHIVIMVYDITERKQAEEELSSLYRASGYLFKSDSLRNLGSQIVEAVVHEFEHVDCGVLLVDKVNNTMLRLARTGEYAVNTDAPLYLDGPGLVPEAVRAGKIVYTPDVSTNPDYVINDSRTCSELVIPLHTAKGVLGVLDLQSAKLDAFSQRDQRILIAFAERAAGAIEIVQLYEEIHYHATSLEGQVTQRTMQLQQAKERIETIINNISDAIILLNADGTIQQVNRAFSRLFGYISEETFHKPLTFLTEPEQIEPLKQAVQNVTTTGKIGRLELRMRDKSGTMFDADVALAPASNHEGQAPSVICSVRDITQRKQAEEDLRRSLKKEKELNELKSRFVAMVSHEFRTPLTSILTSADLIRRYRDRLSEEKQQEYFDRINSQVYRLTAMMDDVLTIGQGDIKGITAYPEPVDLGAFCRNIVDEIQPTAPEHKIQLGIMGDCTQANIDPKLFRQTLYNLLSNAIKYSPHAGTVCLEVLREDETVIIRVIDHGMGIPEADQKHLFEEFWRASNVGKIQGTGLGLVIVKQAVEALKGTISVKSVAEVGTTFTIVMPLKTV